MLKMSRRQSLVLGFSAVAVSPGAIWAAAPVADDPWPGLVTDVFSDTAMQRTDSVVIMEAPYRSLDAALTPLTVNLSPPAGDAIKTVTLVVDRNPAPVAAVFRLGETADVSRIETRIRVNENTAMHAVAETVSGKLYVSEKFIKAAGGCSAPSIKNQDEAVASLGKMKLRQFGAPTSASAPREVQLQIRHPNNSGFQVDQVTHYYIPARFVSDIKLWQGEDLIVGIEGGISLSEDPTVRVTFRHNGAKSFRADILDTDQAAFSASWDAIPPGSSAS